MICLVWFKNMLNLSDDFIREPFNSSGGSVPITAGPSSSAGVSVTKQLVFLGVRVALLLQR